jgi:DNA-binding transcriptional ArsR family regulator
MFYSLEAKAQEVADILKLVAHPKRLLILCRLSQDSATVGELEDFC